MGKGIQIMNIIALCMTRSVQASAVTSLSVKQIFGKAGAGRGRGAQCTGLGGVGLGATP